MKHRIIVAVLCVIALAAPVIATSGMFPDVPTDHRYADAIRWAGEEELFLGYPDGRFGPVDQVDGWDPPKMKVPGRTERVREWIDSIHDRSPIEVEFDPQAPSGSFQPKEKLITLPILERFENAAAAESTLCHELAHATSVLPGTERETSTEFGSLPYAREELIADSANWLMGLSLGRAPSDDVTCGTEGNAVSYLANWAGKFSPEEIAVEIPSIAKQAVAASRTGVALISDKRR